MVTVANDDLQQPPNGPTRPEWLDWPSDEMTRNLNEYADKHDTTLDPALAKAQARALLENCEWE